MSTITGLNGAASIKLSSESGSRLRLNSKSSTVHGRNVVRLRRTGAGVADATRDGPPTPGPAELDPTESGHSNQHAVSRELIDAADRLLAAVQNMNPRPRKDLQLAVATFAAYEAKRDLKPNSNASIGRLYWLFLAVTAASPFLVALTPSELHSVVWDAVGLSSTMLLLYLTYGVYTVKALGQASFEVGGLVSDPLNWRSSQREHLTASEALEGHDRREAIFALFLLMLGTVFFGLAVYNLWNLGVAAHELHAHATAHLEELSRVSNGVDGKNLTNESQRVAQLISFKAIYTSTYCWYFICIWLLSILFIIMDGSVAIFNASHSESYIAASSAAFVTVPMSAGISLVGLYLSAEYISGLWGGEAVPVAGLSVEFASGALTFQMMLSNIIFVVMKKNWVFRAFYNAVETSSRP